MPLAGDAPVTIATPQSPSGLVVLNGVAYFTASQPVGAPDAQGRLDGSSVSTLVAANAFSLAVAYGRLYFSTGTEIRSIPTSGGDVRTLASGLRGAGMLVVSGGNVVWVDPAMRALSDATVPKVMTACMR